MGLKSPLSLDAVTQNELGLQIRDLKEKIAHLRTYTNQDVELLEMQLESLIDQHKQEVNQGE